MGDYNIKITFTDDQVQQMNSKSFKLCFANGVGTDTTLNVAAWTGHISTNTNIGFQEQYQISASKKEFSAGVTVTQSTNPASIQFQQNYTLPPDWTDGSISPDTSLSAEAFRFTNNSNDPASVVLHKLFNGKSLPFYVSPSPISPMQHDDILPTFKIALWFGQDINTGTMIATSDTPQCIFDMTTKRNLELTYDTNTAKFFEV